MCQILQHDQKVYLEVKSETEFGRRIEYAVGAQEIPTWRDALIGLPPFQYQVPEDHNEYHEIGEAYCRPDNL